MKKIVSFLITATMAAAALPGLTVYAAEATKSTVASHEACIMHTKDSDTLSEVAITTKQGKMNGSSSADAYKLIVTSNDKPQYLFLRFNLSDYTDWDVSEAELAFNVYHTNTGSASAINIYAADTLTGSLAGIPTTYASNASAVTGISVPSNLKDTFYIKGNGTGDGSSASNAYLTNPGIRINRDLTSYIKGRVDAGCDSATIMFEMVNATKSYQSFIATKDSAYAPELTVTGTPTVAYTSTVAKPAASTALIKADASSGDLTAGTISGTSYKITDVAAGHTATKSHDRVFVQFDLSGISTISKAELITKITNTNTTYTSNVKMYKADGIIGTPADIISNYTNISGLVGAGAAVDTSIGSNLLKTIQVRSTYTGHKDGKEETADITSYINERIAANASTATVMIEFEGGDDNSAYVAYVSATDEAPMLAVTAKGMPASGIASAHDKISASYMAYETASEPVNPIIAIYDKTDNFRFVDCAICDPVSLTGSGSKVNAEMPVAKGTDYSKLHVKFFLWDAELNSYYYDVMD